MTNPENAASPSLELDVRTKFLRDAVVFQGKLVVDGLLDVILFPVAAIAIGIDLIKRDEPPGRHFYDVVHFGRQTEQWINLFEAADRAPETDQPRPKIDAPSLDEFVNKFEQKLKAEHEKGDISASAKQAFEQMLDAVKKVMTSER
jgi:hypothetical protein